MAACDNSLGWLLAWPHSVIYLVRSAAIKVPGLLCSLRRDGRHPPWLGKSCSPFLPFQSLNDPSTPFRKIFIGQGYLTACAISSTCLIAKSMKWLYPIREWNLLYKSRLDVEYG